VTVRRRFLVAGAAVFTAWGCSAALATPEAGITAGSEAGPLLRVVSYNIRHGRGMDDVVDLDRTARVIRELSPDLVGLQEVDRGAERSGGTDQAAELGARLGLHAVFGAFMDYQGGAYGMAILSRFPPIRSWSIPLPEGNEPRIALAVAVSPAPGDTLVLVNVHFDWVADDRYRLAQARALASVLDTLSHPHLLVGDLNDEPGSPTVELFRRRMREAEKPPGERFTFVSERTRREREIDYIFAAPAEAWRIREVRVVPESRASDHRPVLAVLERQGSEW
jgi:endonuclease/exonuclease/phosphatase family metal-dependent hydrolase